MKVVQKADTLGATAVWLQLRQDYVLCFSWLGSSPAVAFLGLIEGKVYLLFSTTPTKIGQEGFKQICLDELRLFLKTLSLKGTPKEVVRRLVKIHSGRAKNISYEDALLLFDVVGFTSW